MILLYGPQLALSVSDSYWTTTSHLSISHILYNFITFNLLFYYHMLIPYVFIKTSKTRVNSTRFEAIYSNFRLIGAFFINNIFYNFHNNKIIFLQYLTKSYYHHSLIFYYFHNIIILWSFSFFSFFIFLSPQPHCSKSKISLPPLYVMCSSSEPFPPPRNLQHPTKQNIWMKNTQDPLTPFKLIKMDLFNPLFEKHNLTYCYKVVDTTIF
jgi:hypothetical protein